MLIEKKCYICGKEFIAGGEYVYKKNPPQDNGRTRWYCSWSHYRQAEREEKDKAYEKCKLYKAKEQSNGVCWGTNSCSCKENCPAYQEFLKYRGKTNAS